jgi:hypothetical protein
LPSFSSTSVVSDDGKSDISGTGYHPPLTGFITAGLWKTFGKNLYGSHIFIFCCSLILIFNTFKLFSALFPNKPIGIFMLLPLLDSSFLTQLAIASPDIILTTAFVVCLRAIVDDKKILLSIAYIFLCLVNMRGCFAGALVFAFFLFYRIICSKEKATIRQFAKKILPFLPGIILLVSFFTYYFSQRYWFFSDPEFQSNHYKTPESLFHLVKNVAVHLFLLTENGKLFVWSFCLFLLVKFLKTSDKTKFTERDKSFVFLFISFLLMYLILTLITQHGGLGSRYYMPYYFSLTVIIFILLDKIRLKRMSVYVFILVFFLLAGNFSVYLLPEKLAKNWDTTLGHLPFYALREQCFDYMDANNIPYEKASAGFCLYGNQRYVDLKPTYRHVSNFADMDEKQYFIYSNISNLSDEIIDSLHDKSQWTLLKEFKKGAVFISLYERVDF